MKRAALAVLLMAVVATLAGAVLLRPRGETRPPPNCGGRALCGEDEISSPPDATRMPGVSSSGSDGALPPAASASVPGATVAGAAPTPTPVGRADADRLLAAGKITEAVEVFRAVVAAQPTAENHGDFGSLLARLTAFDEAAVQLRAAAELDPGNADRWIALANVFYRKVNPGEAWKAEKRAREAEPGLELGRDADGMRVRKSAPSTTRRP
jgi:hypothetical protein